MTRNKWEVCKNCRFFKEQLHQPLISIYDETQYAGKCKRFPKEEPKNKEDWCGEYVGK